MTKHEIERESWWERLDRAMGRGLYPMSIFVGAPLWRTAMSAAYGTNEREARSNPRQPESVTR
jgi:hypothetical protein